MTKEKLPDYADGFFAKQKKLISEFLEKILAFNYALPVEPQIIEIREWLEEKLQ